MPTKYFGLFVVENCYLVYNLNIITPSQLEQQHFSIRYNTDFQNLFQIALAENTTRAFENISSVKSFLVIQKVRFSVKEARQHLIIFMRPTNYVAL